VDLIVHDIDTAKVKPFVDAGAGYCEAPVELIRQVDMLITCLPSPTISASVMEGDQGALKGFSTGKIWLEMSTTDEAEVRRLGARVMQLGGRAADCPVSGGCHRAETGNIAILAGCERTTFEQVLPVLSIMGREILHTGPLGSASTLKVCTNYLATANLVSVCEALTVSKAAGLDLATAYQAIRISSGNSFVHETEGQVILNGSRNINFTMDLVLKDLGLFQQVADRRGVDLDLSPLLLEVFRDGQTRFGAREWSPNIIRRLEEATGLSVTAAGFPAEIIDDEEEMGGVEVGLSVSKG
jgi:3-hydroxyisobutyrate dehydrogenase